MTYNIFLAVFPIILIAGIFLYVIYMTKKELFIETIYEAVSEAERVFGSKQGKTKFEYVYVKAIDFVPIPIWLKWVLKSKYFMLLLDKFICKTIEESVIILKKML